MIKTVSQIGKCVGSNVGIGVSQTKYAVKHGDRDVKQLLFCILKQRKTEVGMRIFLKGENRGVELAR